MREVLVAEQPRSSMPIPADISDMVDFSIDLAEVGCSPPRKALVEEQSDHESVAGIGDNAITQIRCCNTEHLAEVSLSYLWIVCAKFIPGWIVGQDIEHPTDADSGCLEAWLSIKD